MRGVLSQSALWQADPTLLETALQAELQKLAILHPTFQAEKDFAPYNLQNDELSERIRSDTMKLRKYIRDNEMVVQKLKLQAQSQLGDQVRPAPEGIMLFCSAPERPILVTQGPGQPN